MPSPRASPREEGKRNPRPGRGRGRCPGSGSAVSATLPAWRARKPYAARIPGDGKGLIGPETGTPLGPPPAGPAPHPHSPRLQVPALRAAGCLGSRVPGRRGGRRASPRRGARESGATGGDRVRQGSAEPRGRAQPPASALKVPGGTNADSGRRRSAHEVRASLFSRFHAALRVARDAPGVDGDARAAVALKTPLCCAEGAPQPLSLPQPP